MIGLGNIARSMIELCWREGGGRVALVGVLVRAPRAAEAEAWLGGRAPVTTSVPDLLAVRPDIVAECAGHAALKVFGEPVLEAGCDLVTLASGAFSDRAFEARMRALSRERGRRILVPSGAIVGIDGLAAARHGGLTRVVYSGTKPVNAWRGTAAETAVDLDGLTEPATFFEGSAREASSRYPMNANVTATVALAGIGFDETRVRLIADPAARGNLHALDYEGAFGHARIEIQGRPSPTNPKTSMLTAFSLWRTLIDEAGAAIRVG
ncbi:putative L-aspartate dehydrogenase [Hypericibacter adhaerens]|uniref:L-aspartate dehydrogenase n=1 Tax=Hypericibacter adhaerens TaxID=2602016 RepID=A0A5J6N9N3_9PROT|nr:putative L-aspartate dehydrogenase [Hypericibacter adhaerens]